MANSGIVRQTLTYGLGLVIMKSVSLFMLPYLANRLDLEDFGRLEVLLSLLAVGTVLVGLGLTDALFRFAGEKATQEDRAQLAAQILGLVILAGCVALLAGQLVAPLITRFVPGGATVFEVRLILGLVALEGFIAVPLAWLRMTDRATQFLCLTCGKALIQALLVLAALENDLGVTGVLGAGLIAAGAQATLLVGLQIRDSGIAWSRSTSKSVARYGLPIVVGGLAAFSTAGLDKLIVASAAGAIAIAEYAVASKFALVVAILLQPFGMWWFPRRFMVLKEHDGRARAAAIAGLGSALGIVVAVGVALSAPLVLKALFPPEYAAAAELVPWLVAAMALKNAAELMNAGCYTGTTTHTQLGINLVGAAAGVTFLLLLIPSWGAKGAGCALVLTQLVRLGLFMFLSQRTLRLPYPNGRLIALASAAVLMLALGSKAEDPAAAILVALLGWIGMGASLHVLRLIPSPRAELRGEARLQ